VVADKAVGDPRDLCHDGWIQVCIVEGVERAGKRRAQQALVADAVHAAGLLYQQTMEPPDLFFA